MPGAPKASPEATLSKPPFEPPFGLSFGKRHVSRVPIHRTLPEAPECAASPASDTSPGSLRVRHVSRVPKPGEFLRMSPESPRVPSARAERPLPGTFRVRRVFREPTPRDHPGHSASTPRVPGSVSFLRRILENTRRCLKLCKIIEIQVLVRKIPNQFSQLAFDDT